VVILESDVSNGNSVSLIFDSDKAKELAVCPYLVRMSFVVPRLNSPNFWNYCSLIKGRCPFRGKRLKFASFGIDSLRVVWCCPRIKDLSFLKVDVHG
jgi:hypothetical protein